MNLPPIDLSTVLCLSYLFTFLFGARGLTGHLRDGVSGEGNVRTSVHPTPEANL